MGLWVFGFVRVCVSCVCVYCVIVCECVFVDLVCLCLCSDVYVLGVLC